MNKYIDKDGWVHCPICGGKTRIKVLDNTILKDFPLFCPKCKNVCIINIEKEKLTKVKPDA